MSSEQYKELIHCCLKNGKSLTERINCIEGFIDNLDDLVKIHKKIQKELEDYLMPHYDEYEKQGLVKGKEYLRELFRDIKTICFQSSIDVVFTKDGTEEFKKKIFAYYSIDGNSINSLIYYNKVLKVNNENDILEWNM